MGGFAQDVGKPSYCLGPLFSYFQMAQIRYGIPKYLKTTLRLDLMALRWVEGARYCLLVTQLLLPAVK